MRDDFGSSVKESSEESTVESRPNKKSIILHSKYSHSTYSCNDLHDMVNKNEQKKKKSFKTYRKSNKELNVQIEKSFKCLSKIIKGGREKRIFSTFKKCRFVTMKVKRVSPAWQKA